MKKKTIPLRKCIGCQEMKPKMQLVRILSAQDGAVEVDATGKKNGRGAYLCRNTDCLEQALKSRALERSLKCRVSDEAKEKLKKEMEAFGGI